MRHPFQKNYTRIIGVYALVIFLLLFLDIYKNSLEFSPELFHKLFHLLLFSIIIKNWNNPQFYKPFTVYNSTIFIFLAAFGFSFPEFAINTYLQAFSTTYTFLYALVGFGGLFAYFADKISV